MSATGSAMNWRAAGACLSADPDLFFPISSAGPAERQIARAKKICAGCGVRRECLEFALSHEQVYGIWGGTTPEDRQRERRRKRRARPPPPGAGSRPSVRPRASGLRASAARP